MADFAQQTREAWCHIDPEPGRNVKWLYLAAPRVSEDVIIASVIPPGLGAGQGRSRLAAAALAGEKQHAAVMSDCTAVCGGPGPLKQVRMNQGACGTAELPSRRPPS